MIEGIFLVILAGATSLFAAANTYRVELYKPITINGTELKAGTCKVEVLDNKVVVTQGKTTAEAPAKIEQGSQKFYSTTVTVGQNSNQAEEIRLAGTNTKIVFEAAKTDVASDNKKAGTSGSK